MGSEDNATSARSIRDQLLALDPARVDRIELTNSSVRIPSSMESEAEKLVEMVRLNGMLVLYRTVREGDWVIWANAYFSGPLSAMIWLFSEFGDSRFNGPAESDLPE